MYYLKNSNGEYLVSYTDIGPMWGTKSEAMKITQEQKEYYELVFKFCTFEEIS